MKDTLSYIELSKSNFLHNINQFRSILSRKNKLVAVVKANAYGHGLKEVVSITHRTVDYFQVDDMSELIEIRKYTDKPVLVFGYVSLYELNLTFELNAILGVYNIETLEMLISLSKKRKNVSKSI